MAAYTIVYARIGTIEIDVSESETHSSSSEITEHPVENGVKISDHIRDNQDTLTMNCLLSNTPVGRVQQTRISNLYDGVPIQTNAPSAKPGYAQDAYRKLLQLKKDKQLLTVVTAIRTYQNMAIASIGVPRDSKSGDALRFSMTLKQIVVVSTQFSDKTVAKEKKAHKRVKVGLKVPTAATAKQTPKQSLALKANNALGDILGVNP